jgi:hypothetical protein
VLQWLIFTELRKIELLGFKCGADGPLWGLGALNIKLRTRLWVKKYLHKISLEDDRLLIDAWQEAQSLFPKRSRLTFHPAVDLHPSRSVTVGTKGIPGSAVALWLGPRRGGPRQ